MNRVHCKTLLKRVMLVLLTCATPTLMAAIQVYLPIGLEGNEDRLQPYGSTGDAAYEPNSAYDESLHLEIRLGDLGYSYVRAVANALEQSETPRDMALVTLLASPSPPTDQAHLAALAKRASDTSPDDILVQWLAFVAANKTRGEEKNAAAALHTLQRMDPDNGVVWMLALDRAWRTQDVAAYESALQRMATSTAWTEYDNGVYKILLDAYQRHPLSQKHRELLARRNPPQSSLAEYYELAKGTVEYHSVGAILNNYNALDDACTVDPGKNKNVNHTDVCARIGRLMFNHGNSASAIDTGEWMLAVTAAFTDEDVKRSRQQDWIYLQYAQLTAMSNEPITNAEMIADGSDREKLGNELDVMRHALSRAGKTLAPPADWKDERSPFVRENLQQRLKSPRFQV
ncbi:hypothetical protein ELE36_11065 [Pseudolysobacter antarcticus]|uniref:Tetratricopeptide repeat protein n=1 Tax=Pseudolysobacter antarcticus TaxID=2511995 RepID=A0A411HK46_9GAMM|nr:hypothetical protein [Pseudolysobacter antarcticus]QBB70851.1 hypothetical protein ELE36_11065 [Pseudolysobacter antarcticus]